MMEHANLRQQQHDHHQLQDGQLELSGSSSSSSNSTLSTAPSSYGGAAGSSHAWTQNFTLNTNNFNPNCDGVVLNPRHKNDPLIPSYNSSMIQHLTPHWSTNAGSFTSQSPHEDLLNLAKIKEELSSDSFPKFTDMLTSSSSSIEDQLDLSYIKNDQKNLTDLSEKLLLKTISSGFPLNGHHFSPGGEIFAAKDQFSSFGSGILPGRPGSFSQIYPSVNISNLNRPSSSSIPGSFDMNLQALDLLNSTSFSGSFGQDFHDSLSTYKASPSFGRDLIRSSPRSSCSPGTISSPFNKEITTESKRPSSSLMESKANQAHAPKKSRVESRASCPPLKVRKEKLGDRVAALQQLVAPFGKTDTASVLMEAIGYIKFLQNQVETLSVPYMKSSRNKTNVRNMHPGSTMEDGNEEPTRDLRSRGLCLVPLSCMSYVTSIDGSNVGGGVWPPPPPNFGGGT